MRVRSSSAAVLAATTLGLSAAIGGVADAHVQVVSTTPAAGATAKASLPAVKVLFNGPVRSGTLRVTGPGGAVASTGVGGRDPRNIKRLMVALRRGLHSGIYTARWTAVAADGHRESGSFTFRLKA
jgi:methionine-rich copper-binding protein CopC